MQISYNSRQLISYDILAPYIQYVMYITLCEHRLYIVLCLQLVSDLRARTLRVPARQLTASAAPPAPVCAPLATHSLGHLVYSTLVRTCSFLLELSSEIILVL